MARKASHTNAEVVQAAMDYIDANGIESLTLRSLGSALGMHHTSVYRYFPSKEALLGAVFDELMSQIIELSTPQPTDPQDRLIALCQAARQVLRAHPVLVSSVVQTSGTSPNVIEVQRRAMAALQDMGLADDDLAVAYRIIETYLFGASMFDFTGAPNHLTQRQHRYRTVALPGFIEASANAAAVDDLNERSFDAGLTAIVSSLAARASAQL